jgi:hypothetical protein
MFITAIHQTGIRYLVSKLHTSTYNVYNYKNTLHVSTLKGPSSHDDRMLAYKILDAHNSHINTGRIMVFYSDVLRSLGSSVSIVSDYRPGDRGSIPNRGKRIFPLTSVSRLALRPIQPPVQWVPGVLSQG